MSDNRGQPMILRVGGMDCADCALHLEQAASQLADVDRVSVSFATGRMRVYPHEGKDVLSQVQTVAGRLGYAVYPETDRVRDRQGLLGFLGGHKRDWPVGIAAVVLLASLAIRLIAGAGPIVDGLLMGATLLAGYPRLRAGWAALRVTKGLDMNVLMSLAAIGALAIGEYAEAAVVTFLFAAGNLLEAYTMDRARGAIQALTDLSPQEATRLTSSGEERVSVDDLGAGDLILVRPGERIPADGMVTEGRSSVDQSSITGESMPAEKGVGDTVFAGTINGSGALTVRASRAAEDSTLARIIQLVEEAQEQRAPAQRFVDRFARLYTPAVVLTAVVIAGVPPLIGLGGIEFWLYRALVLLVIACPCALVISTPVAVVSGLTAAARAGALIKGGIHLEQLARLRAVAFDKTGTLTLGRPQLAEGHCAGHDPALRVQECDACLDLLAKAAAVERRADHPLARAVVEAARLMGVDRRYAMAADVEAIAGQGVRGWVDGHNVTVGSHRFIHGDRPVEPFCELVERKANGQTVVVIEDTCCGTRAFGLAEDALRGEARQAIDELRQAGIEHTVMLTGDSQVVATAIGEAAGVDVVRAGLLPEQKVEAVRELLETYGTVAMVGDGVNDAPALARASVGIAMGAAGSDVALETADVALMGDDLRGLPYAVKLGQAVSRIIRQNIILSLATKGVFLMLAVAGVATLWMAVFADMGISLIVTLNGMRPLARRR